MAAGAAYPGGISATGFAGAGGTFVIGSGRDGGGTEPLADELAGCGADE